MGREGQVLYFDGATAICDYQDELEEFSSSEDALACLLAIDIGSPDIEKHVKPLLKDSGFYMPPDYGGHPNEESEEMSRLADEEELRSLGVVLVDGVPRLDEEHVLDMDDRMRCVVSVKRSYEAMIRDRAEAVQYLARLHLLASGDFRSGYILPDIDVEIDNLSSFQVELPVPDDIAFGLVDAGSPFVRLQKIAGRKGGGASVLLTMRSVLLDATLYGLEGEDATPCPGLSKRIVAANILSSLLNSKTGAPYVVGEGLSLALQEGDGLFNRLATAIIEGKVGACPHCGHPVLMRRKSSTPFCRKSHQIRYSESARLMLGAGAGVEDVSAAYPHINRKTIENWLPMERTADHD